jgi:hypothetical protein
MPNEPGISFVFVPHGALVPDKLRGADWVRIPATLVPRGSRRLTPSGQPWPSDRNGRDWPMDRFGRPICPLAELPPGGPAPGEATLGNDDPVAAYLAAGAAFHDPAAAAGPGQAAAAGGGSNTGGSPSSGPAAPDWSGKPAIPQPGKPPVSDISSTMMETPEPNGTCLLPSNP